MPFPSGKNRGSMKNLILLDNYPCPSELEARISEWVNYYNNHRYHEAIDNVTPSDRFYGKDKAILFLISILTFFRIYNPLVKFLTGGDIPVSTVVPVFISHL